MGYILTEEQQFLKDSAVDMFKKTPVSMIRELRDSNDENGFSASLWRNMIEMGWPGIAVSEELGGLNFGLRSLGILFEESGRTLSASPLMSATVSGLIIQKYGNETQKNIVKDICLEGRVVALAVQEGEFYDPETPTVEAIHRDGGYTIRGSKDLVADGHVASHFIISTHSDRGVTTFLIQRNQTGVSVEKEFMMDSQYYSKVTFDNVEVSESEILGKPGQGKKVINDITNSSNALISAELIGLMTESFERTVEYLKERRQFDRAIGSFQGLQHRAADLYGEIEIARSVTMKALDALDESDVLAPALCSMAKAKCIKVAQRATNEGIQMFGGIGMTDDEEIGFFLKRARVAAQLYGGYSYHLDRFAKMNGY